MATMRQKSQFQVGSASWIAEERKIALEVAETEAEEFTFSAKNEVEWLNEHMAEIFTRNQVNVANIFKTPGKLRGKTPRTAKKLNPLEVRAPLSDVFSATPQGAPSPFRQAHFERPIPTFRVAEDEPQTTQPLDEPTQAVDESTQPVDEPAQPLEEPTQPADGPTQLSEEPTVSPRPSSSSTVNNDDPFQRRNVVNYLDSGYYGSQVEEATQPNTQVNDPKIHVSTPPRPTAPRDDLHEVVVGSDAEVEAVVIEEVVQRQESEERRTSGTSFQSANEVRTGSTLQPEIPIEGMKQSSEEDQIMEDVAYPNLDIPLQDESPTPQSQSKITPRKSPPKSPEKAQSPSKSARIDPQSPEIRQHEDDEDEPMDEAPIAPSPSDGSSPIRPIVRKSSLNFASLPAREPLTTKKSIGNRVSRTSHLEQSRTSYYGRLTGGKSLGNVKQDTAEDTDEMDIDDLDDPTTRDESDTETAVTRTHNKTSTQRLQDQISMLGQSQAVARPASKSLVGSIVAPTQSSHATHSPTPPQTREEKHSPQRKDKSAVAPGAFPEDDDDSWIGPATTTSKEPSVFSPRPTIGKTYTTDVMENARDVTGSKFNMPKRGEEGRQKSPSRESTLPEHTLNTLSHTKSVSTSFIAPLPEIAGAPSNHKKAISVSNPTPSFITIDEDSSTQPKSPPRTLRGSPLKAAKDKFSSILKSSRGLFASSAAVSAEAKTETLSPPSARLYHNPAPSLEDVLREESNESEPSDTAAGPQPTASYRPQSASKASIRKTRASTEREERKKEEAAREAREAKEAQKVNEQLEKARTKVKEEARIFHEEQERVANMQKQALARKEQEKLAKSSQADVPRATRSSPRKTKAQQEAEANVPVSAPEVSSTQDADMIDAPASMPPPAIPRPKSQIGRPGGAKRPLKPVKESASKAKPATVIRVDTSSSRGQQYHPSNATLSNTLQESLQTPSASTSSQPGHLRNKASSSSIQSKASTNSFKAAANKALEAAARKKKEDELAAERKKAQKLEIDRQRAAAKEEERRQQELARKRDLERQQIQNEAKRSASRQMTDKRRLELERAKQMGAPPPAIRPQANIDQWQEKALPSIPQQRNDLGGPSKATRMNAQINTAKAPPKRPLQHEANDEHNSRPAAQRAGASYHESHSKRVRTNEYLEGDDELTESHPKMTAPPIRQSSVRQKEIPTKSLFPSGYAHAPPPANLQKTTLMSQHQSKAVHPLDMTTVSKSTIPFASSSSHTNGQSYKTPARSGTASHVGKSAKSVAKSSPRYENGENIDLPEILTDSDEEDSDEEKPKNEFTGLGWTDSPEIRKQLALQETIDPSEVFGRPGPLNMEEVFSKSKDRFHKFRARTSSANWSGTDRLTDDEVRKDLEGRDRVRRQGGWTYDSMV